MHQLEFWTHYWHPVAGQFGIQTVFENLSYTVFIVTQNILRDIWISDAKSCLTAELSPNPDFGAFLILDVQISDVHSVVWIYWTPGQLELQLDSFCCSLQILLSVVNFVNFDTFHTEVRLPAQHSVLAQDVLGLLNNFRVDNWHAAEGGCRQIRHRQHRSAWHAVQGKRQHGWPRRSWREKLVELPAISEKNGIVATELQWSAKFELSNRWKAKMKKIRPTLFENEQMFEVKILSR